MAMTKEKLLSVVDGLIQTGERLSDVRLVTHQSENVFGISYQHPADQSEYARWDGSCANFLRLLGAAGKHWTDGLSTSSFGDGQEAKAKLGTLRAIKDAIENDLLNSDEPSAPTPSLPHS